jgi:hypothetical protein
MGTNYEEIDYSDYGVLDELGYHITGPANISRIALKPLFDGQPFAPIPTAPDILDEVTFIRANSVSAETQDTASGLYEDSFHISVIGVTDVTEPTNLYHGLVNSRCADGLTTVDAEGDERVLVYSPPVPPRITYDFAFPDRPEITLLAVDLPHNDTDTSPLSTGGDLYLLLKEQAELLVGDVLKNLSQDTINAFNDKLFNPPMGLSLSLMGTQFSSQNINKLKNRVKNSLSRKLLIVNRRANNSRVPSFSQNLSVEDKRRHGIHQQAILDNAKLNVSLNMKDIAMSVLVYNKEVQNANLIYTEYFAIVEIEVEKLNLYSRQIKAYNGAQEGNDELLAAYRKQLSVVEQVFTTFEQEMSLSETVLNLTRKYVEVETLNIDTDIKKVEGSVAKADSVAYQVKSSTMAYGLDADGTLAKASADLMANRANVQNELLGLDVKSKNSLIDADNDLVAVLAESAGIKARAVSLLFDLESKKSLNRVSNSYDSSHNRARIQTAKDNFSLGVSENAASAKNRTIYDQARANSGARQGHQAALRGVQRYNYWVGKAAEVLREAKTTQKLIQNISS